MKKIILVVFFVLFFTMPVWPASLAWEQPEIENVVGWKIETSVTDDPATFAPMVFDGFDGTLLKEDAAIEAGEFVFSLPVGMEGQLYMRIKAFNHAHTSEPSNVVLGIFDGITSPVKLRFVFE